MKQDEDMTRLLQVFAGAVCGAVALGLWLVPQDDSALQLIKLLVTVVTGLSGLGLILARSS